jgi:rhodanese-related sulfurtransferase
MRAAGGRTRLAAEAMDTLAFLLALLSIVLTLAALARTAALGRKLEEAQGEARRAAELAAEQERRLETLRQLTALVAEHKGVTREMILEGRLWRGVSAAEAQGLLAAGGVGILDVRTPQETSGGILPGALCIPIDELPQRVGELPQGDRPTLVYCAGGGRSAAACEFLSQQGRSQLLNLEGGISSWPGPTVRPTRG